MPPVPQNLFVPTWVVVGIVCLVIGWAGGSISPNVRIAKAVGRSSTSDVERTTTGSGNDEINQFSYRIALWLMYLFGISLVCGFVIVLVMLISYFNTKPFTSADAVPIYKEVIDILRLIGGIFSPLLAFVLGYYFNQSNKNPASIEAAGDKIKQAGEKLKGEANSNTSAAPDLKGAGDNLKEAGDKLKESVEGVKTSAQITAQKPDASSNP